MHQNVLWLQWVKLEIYNKKTIGKSPNVWVLSNVLLYKWWVKNTHIIMEIRKYLKLNDKDNITYKSLWDATTVVHRGKHTALIADIEKRKTKNHQSIHLKKLGEKITVFKTFGGDGYVYAIHYGVYLCPKPSSCIY